MLSFALDENFNLHIVSGILRRLPTADLVRVQDVGLEGADDPVVLEWAANEGRVLLTHDVNTLTAFAYERVAQGLPMPGVFEVSLRVSISVAMDPARWGNTAVLARTRSIVLPVLDTLRANSVRAFIVTRRDRFISPQFVWLQTCLDQCVRPTDRRVFTAMADAANRIANTEIDVPLLQAEAEAAGNSFLEYWALAAAASGSPIVSRLAEFALRVVQSRAAWRAVVAEAIAWLPETAGAATGVVTDADDDKAAWETSVRAIKAEKGGEIDLAELLQGLALRPKEPPPDASAVSLSTIHSAKGLEFDHVWLIGLAESVLPSWQSLQAKAAPAELEEERRNCFVAITRTRQTLILSRANQYRGWRKDPSRFLKEMGLA